MYSRTDLPSWKRDGTVYRILLFLASNWCDHVEDGESLELLSNRWEAFPSLKQMRSFSFCGIFFILNLPSSTWSNQFEAKESNLQYSLPSRFQEGSSWDLEFLRDFSFLWSLWLYFQPKHKTFLFWNTWIWQTKQTLLEQVRVNGQSAKPFPQQMQLTRRWSCDQVVLKAMRYIPTIYSYKR